MGTPRKKPLHKTVIATVFGGKTKLSRVLLGVLDVVPIALGAHNVVKAAVKKSESGMLDITLGELPAYIGKKYELSRGASALIVFGLVVTLLWGDDSLDLTALLQILSALLGGGVAMFAVRQGFKNGDKVKMIESKALVDEPAWQSIWVGSNRIFPGDTFEVSDEIPFGVHVRDGAVFIHPGTLASYADRFVFEGEDIGEALHESQNSEGKHGVASDGTMGEEQAGSEVALASLGTDKKRRYIRRNSTTEV